MQCRYHQSQLVSSDDEDGGGAGILKWMCVRFDHGRCERQEVGPFRLENSGNEAEEKLRSEAPAVTSSITSFDSVRHNTVADLHKAER